MDDAEFERIINLGLGRALLYLREHPASRHHTVIVQACTHNTAYDAQVEGSRAEYLLEVLRTTGDPNDYRGEILDALRVVTKNHDADQLFEIALRFAQSGKADARDAMYEKFRKNDVDEPFTGAETLIELDGIPAVLTVAQCIGRGLLANPDAWIDASLLDVGDRLCGKDRVRDALAQAAVDSPAITAFVAEVETNHRSMNEAGPPASDLAGASYAQVRQMIVDAPGRQPSIVALQRWGRAATDEELTLAADDLMRETNEDRLVSYVRIFGKRLFPLDRAVLLPLVRQPNTKLAAAAFAALSLVTDGRVRALALDLLRDPTGTWFTKGRAVDLLIRNYIPDDATRLAEWLATSRDRDEFHAIGFGALDVLQAYPTADGVPALLALYEHGPCSNCRRQALELLHSLGAMPAWMLEEARFDASLSIRQLAAAWTTAA